MPSLSPEQYFSSYRGIIPDFAVFCRKLFSPLPVHLRINTLKGSVAEIRSRLERRGLLLRPEEPIGIVFRVQNIKQPGHLPEYALGHVHSQAFSSVLSGLSLGSEPGEVVLDMCAAPGSKTTLLGQLMGNKGVIVANEKKASRLVPLRANLKRLGVTNALLTRYPGQHFPKRFGFDRVLVDVPCSAEGTLRAGRNGTIQRPSLTAKELPTLQRELLIRAFDLLKPGGTLLYSTCTYKPDENESVIQFLLENRPAKIQPITLEMKHSPGLDRWQEMVYDSTCRVVPPVPVNLWLCSPPPVPSGRQCPSLILRFPEQSDRE